MQINTSLIKLLLDQNYIVEFYFRIRQYLTNLDSSVFFIFISFYFKKFRDAGNFGKWS